MYDFLDTFGWYYNQFSTNNNNSNKTNKMIFDNDSDKSVTRYRLIVERGYKKKKMKVI